jgi:hypothetical protein
MKAFLGQKQKKIKKPCLEATHFQGIFFNLIAILSPLECLINLYKTISGLKRGQCLDLNGFDIDLI